jgi:hypothetical protein
MESLVNINTLMDLASDQAATLTDTNTGAVWTCQRNGAFFVMTSPAFEFDAHHALDYLRGFLLDNVSGNLSFSGRFVAVEQNTVHLEWQTAPDQLESAWQDACATFTQIQTGLAQAMQHSERHAQSDASMGDDTLTPEQVALFTLLNSLVEQSVELMAVYEFQPEHGLAMMESDDGNWLACVRPSVYPDQLSLLFPLAVVVEDAQQALSQCTWLLQWNSVLSLGVGASIGCLSDGQTLVLKAELNPRQADVQDVLALLGKLTMMTEELQQGLNDVQELSVPAQATSAPTDSMALMMSGMLA